MLLLLPPPPPLFPIDDDSPAASGGPDRMSGQIKGWRCGIPKNYRILHVSERDGWFSIIRPCETLQNNDTFLRVEEG